MKRPARLGIGGLLMIAAFLAGRTIGAPSSPGVAKAGRAILYYHDPMHPAYTSDKPGTAPDCGMALEPVYADGGEARPAFPSGTVRVSAEKQQLVGVRVGTVERSSPVHVIRTVGRVAADERRIYRINAFVAGSVRKTYSNSVGSLVRKDEPLASFYTRELRNAQQAYLYALDPFNTSAVPANEAAVVGLRRQTQIAADALIALGMSDAQVAELARSRAVSSEIDVVAPQAGFVLARNVSPGQRVEVGSELYVIGDLSRVWILADVFQHESTDIKPGQAAMVRLAQQNRTFSAQVSDVLPQFDATTRTLKVRLELGNPGFVLRPDMFVDVEFPVRLPPSLTVPSEALLDSGLRKTVFVDRGDGYFEPRRVETGWRLADRAQIVSGLMEGERVVVSGTFLIDSESRLKAAADAMREATVRDPVCGMEIDPAAARAAGRLLDRDGSRHYFCSDACLGQFKARR